jgi:hypothetical protein
MANSTDSVLQELRKEAVMFNARKRPLLRQTESLESSEAPGEKGGPTNQPSTPSGFISSAQNDSNFFLPMNSMIFT